MLATVLPVLNKCGLLLLPEPVCSRPAQSATRPHTRHLGWQELLGHCTALYQENQRRICDLERHLRQYGYKAEFLAPQLGQTRTSGSEEAVVGPGASADPSIVSCILSQVWCACPRWLVWLAGTCSIGCVLGP